MSVNRRDFLKAITAGSAVVGLGCVNAPAPMEMPDAGAMCGQAAPPPLPALDWPSPSYFAQVIFSEVDEGNYFVGGRPLSHGHVFVHGQIRGGRTPESKSTLISSIVKAVAEAASAVLPEGG